MKTTRNIALLVFAMLFCGMAFGRGADGRHMTDRLSRRGASGRIAVRAGGDRLPGDAQVSLTRTRTEKIKSRISEGWARKRKGGGKGPRAGLLAAAASGRGGGASAASGADEGLGVLAMYDVSITAGGRKWQPAVGEPVRVTVELDEPVTVSGAASLGVVHLADDGTVEELPEARRGFVLDATKTAVTAFWFDATGFSVYAIVDNGAGNEPGRRLYDFYSLDFDTTSPTWNQYVPRYFTTVEGNKTFRQIVKSGEYLVDPEVLPSPLGRTFVGWYEYSPGKAGQDGYDAQGYALAKFDFDQPVVFDETGETEIVLRARFAHEAYVVFHEQPVGGDWPITGVRRGALVQNATTKKWETSLDISDMTVTYDDTADEESEHANATPKMIFRGWSLTPVLPGSLVDTNGVPYVIESSPFVITVDNAVSEYGDTPAEMNHVDLYPVFVNINWLTFQAAETGQGATYIPPRFYYADEGTNSFPVPTRTGYTFDGWWSGTNSSAVRISTASGALNAGAGLPTTAEAAAADSAWGGYIRNGKLMFAKNVTIYGRWNKGTTKYVVVILQQSIDDDKAAADADKTYDFYANYVVEAQTESTATVANAYKQLAAASATKADFRGFWYRTCDADQTVKGDGTTVLNVYYDRYTVNYTFNVYYEGSWYQQGGWSATQTMTGLYGQRLAAYSYSWPTEYKWTETYSRSSASGTSITYLDAFNATDYPRTSTNTTAHTITTPLYHNGNNGTTKIYHVMQDVYGNYDMTNAVETLSAGADNTTFNITDKFEGFTAYAYSLDAFTANPTERVSAGDSVSSGSRTLYVYHARNKYTLQFLDSYNGNEYSSLEIYYGAPLADYIPAGNPAPTEASMAQGYSFTGWYTSRETSTRFNFNTTMPMANLRAYAGWETEWYLIEIDPNGGQLAEGQSLWFWEPYNGDPIEEYSTVTRSFVESLSGSWWYAVQDRAYHGLPAAWSSAEDGIQDRSAYYTRNMDDAAIRPGTRYEPAVNAFRYAGWYEVTTDADGNETEELYAFGQPVQHDTRLRLHWKQIGTYHLLYMAGRGRMSTTDENEETLSLLDAGVYADNSEILVTRTAIPPAGYSFTGWRIRQDPSGTVYHPGQSFIFNSAFVMTGDDAQGNVVKQMVLDAVYDKVQTVRITMDANGGLVDNSCAVTIVPAYENPPAMFTNVTDTTRTISGLRNNSYGYLSDGTGYFCEIDGLPLKFLGWNTEADGTGTQFSGGDLVGLDTVGTPDGNGDNYLYAMWGVDVRFDKNNDNAGWQPESWGAQYAYDSAEDAYVQTNAVLHGYATYPNVLLVSDEPDEMFRFWSTNRYTDVSDVLDNSLAYDFSTPLEGPLTLYACWSKFIRVPFHVVDASSAPTLKDNDASWVPGEKMFKIGNVTDIDLSDTPEDPDGDPYVTPPEGYAFAFACVARNVNDLSEGRAVTRLYFNGEQAIRSVYVQYADGTTGPLASDMEIYVVYFTNPKAVDIGYRVMDGSGTFRPAETNVTPAAPGSVHIGTAHDSLVCDMAASVTAPLAYPVLTHGYYAFAIGETNAVSASQMHFITPTSSSDEASRRPKLWIRNSWRGYEYCTETPTEDAAWNLYGHDAQLYVLYFDDKPTIVTFREETVGTADDMTNRFAYVVAVTQVVRTVTQTQTAKISGGHMASYTGYVQYQYGGSTYSFPNDFDWDSPNSSIAVTNVSSRSSVSTTTNDLASSGTESVTLFSTPGTYGAWSTPTLSERTQSGSSWNRTYGFTGTRTRTLSEDKVQTVVITQVPKGGFVTTNAYDVGSGDGKYVYATESESEAATRNVAFTNTRELLEVELHVAFGQNGAVDHVDNNWRTLTEADYTLAVTNGALRTAAGAGEPFAVTEEMLAAKDTAAAGGVLKAEPEGRRFAGVFYGTPDESDGADENKVAIRGRVTSVGFVKMADSPYYGLCLNGDPSLRLGDCSLYYVYSEIPRIWYVKEGANGALTAPDALAYDREPVVLDGRTVTQGAALDVGDDAALVVASTGQNRFRVPLALDGMMPASMNHAGLAAGAAGLANTNLMDCVTAGELQLKMVDGLVKWSADGETWGDFSGAPAVYAIYKEKGHDLTIVETSLASAADRAADRFTIAITSDNLTNGIPYLVTGYEVDGVLQDTVTPVDGTITLTVTNGSRITIMSLFDDDQRYTLVETSLADGYVLTNITFNGENEGISQYQVANGTTTYMAHDKVVEFVNVKRYGVAFTDEDGTTTLKAETPYWYGTAKEAIDVPGDPSKGADATSLYRFKGWEPAVEDVGSNTVYRAAYREIRIPRAAQRAAETNITVRLADEATLLDRMRSVGIDLLGADYSEAEASAKLNAFDANGLRRWENLVTGTAFGQLLLGTAVSSGGRVMTLRLTKDPLAQTNLGYTVLHDLRRWNGDEKRWNRVAGPAEGIDPAFEIALLDAEGGSAGASGLYRVTALTVPDCAPAITNEIPSTNIIGVLEVDSALANTMAAVPWHALASDPASPAGVAVAEWVRNGLLSGVSEVRAVGADGGYEMWRLADGAWTAYTTTRLVDGASASAEAADASVRRLARGGAAWLTREDVSRPFFLVGQYSGESVTVAIAEGDGETLTPTMVANPTLEPVKINGLAWTGTPDTGDQILVPTEEGTPTVLTWNGSNWGVSALVQNPKTGRMKITRVTDHAIPPGRGFWYYRKASGGLSVAFPAIPCK